MKAVHVTDGRRCEQLGIQIIERGHAHHHADAIRAAAEEFDAAVFAEIMMPRLAINRQAPLA